MKFYDIIDIIFIICVIITILNIIYTIIQKDWIHLSMISISMFVGYLIGYIADKIFD